MFWELLRYVCNGISLELSISLIWKMSSKSTFPWNSRLCKKLFVEISQNSQGNTCARVSFLIKLQETWKLIKKETLVQVFSCEFCEISKNTFLHRTPLVTASETSKRSLAVIFFSNKRKEFTFKISKTITSGRVANNWKQQFWSFIL